MVSDCAKETDKGKGRKGFIWSITRLFDFNSVEINEREWVDESMTLDDQMKSLSRGKDLEAKCLKSDTEIDEMIQRVFTMKGKGISEKYGDDEEIKWDVKHETGEEREFIGKNNIDESHLRFREGVRRWSIDESVSICEGYFCPDFDSTHAVFDILMNW